MRRLFFLIACCTIAVPAWPQTKSTKRGVAYGQNSLQDLQTLSTGVSWWYNWFHQPEAAVINSYTAYGFDYVPMAWNGAFNKEAMRTYLQSHPEIKYILGWNEPNFTSQANMTPSQAAAQWHHLEELADEFDLKIVSPAVNFCDVCVTENGTTYTDPVEYLDDFFAACADCQVDYIAIHSYMGNVSALQWYVGLFKKYGKPIWLTEFANWENNPTLDDQKNYLVGAVDYLENDPDVFRYAWFTGRHSGAPYIGLLENGMPGTLTDLGDIYVNMPLHDPEFYQPVPARVEAENYNKMSGILLELTSDVSGFANVGYIDANDWMEYGIDVTEAGTYNLSVRAASTQAAALQIAVNGSFLRAYSIANTNGWQNWQTFTMPVTLAEGKQTVRITASTAGFNLNWFEIAKEVISANDPSVEKEALQIYPNPTTDEINIESPAKFKSVTLFNVLGEPLYTGSERVIPIAHLPAGTYILRLTSLQGKSSIRKIIKK